MKRQILRFGHPLLRTKAKPIEKITPEIRALAEDLIEMMIAHNGVGLAATQVGELHRVFVIREETLDKEGQYHLGKPEVILNARFTRPSKETAGREEGCLSVPGVYVQVERPRRIHVSYQTLDGQIIEEDLEDFRARVMMHENDHLNGVLMIDRISQKERRRIDPQLRALLSKRLSTNWTLGL